MIPIGWVEIDAEEQEGSMMNATLQGAGNGLAVSIAVYLPEGFNATRGLDAEGVKAMLDRDFADLLRRGYHVEIGIGADFADDPLCSRDPQKVLGAMNELFDAADKGRENA